MNLLFLGASNTDCAHCFTPDNLGDGYVRYTAALLRENAAEKNISPETIHVTNGGTDGFTFPRIFQKWQTMYSDQHFDAVVIDGGINDVGVIMNTGLNEAQARSFLRDSAFALTSLLEGLTAQETAQILLVEPFLFSSPAYLKLWLPWLQEIRAILCTCAAPHPKAHILSVQEEFDRLAAQRGLSHVTTDGIHLTEPAHRLLASLAARALRDSASFYTLFH